MEITIELIVTAAVMLVSFIGMLFCAKLQRAYPNIKFMAVLLLLVVIGCGIFIMTKTMGSGDTEKLIENEMKFAKASAIVLGQDLAKTQPGAKILVIAPRDYEKNKRQALIVEGLKEGLGISDIVAIVSPKLPENVNPEEMPIFEEMIMAKDFDEMIAAYPQANLIVSLIGLPQDAPKMKIWREIEEAAGEEGEEGESSVQKKMALLFGEIYLLRDAIALGHIVAAVTFKPGLKFTDDPPPEDPQKAFDERFILITPKNVMEIDKENPNFFHKPK